MNEKIKNKRYFCEKIVCNVCCRLISKANFDRHTCLNKFDIEIIRDLYNKGLSSKDLVKRGFNKRFVSLAIKGQRRSRRESMKLIYKNNPEIFKLSDETKQNISLSMKIAHKEGRAWNIGKSRWNNKPSKPEEMFMKFLNNQGFKIDYDYFHEYNFGIYSADFYFKDLSLVIEIDGQQHYRFIEYKMRDEKKDELIKSFDIDILRINWKLFCNNAKIFFIKINNILKDKNRLQRQQLMKEFSENQISKILIGKNTNDKKNNIKKLLVVLNKIKLKKQEIERQNDILNIDFKQKDNIRLLANKWNVCRVQVNRYIRKHFNK